MPEPDIENNHALRRLEALFSKYHGKAEVGKHFYYFLSITQLLTATSIPLVAIYHPDHPKPFLNGALGAAIVILQGLEQLYRPHRRWTENRFAARKLESEKNRYLEGVGQYRNMSDDERRLTLAEWTENFAERRNAEWAYAMSQSDQRDKATKKAPK
jgi:Protein of unknown function (DUF4231)